MGDLHCRFVDSRTFNTFSLLNPCPSPAKLPFSSLPITPSDHSRRRRRSPGLVMSSKSSPSTPQSPELGLISHAEHSDGTFVFRFGDPSEIEQIHEMGKPDEAATGLESETGEYQTVKVFNQKLEKQVTIINTEIELGRDSSAEAADLVGDEEDEGVLTKYDETDERITADVLDLIDSGVKPNGVYLEDTEDRELYVFEEVPVELSDSVSSESVDSDESVATYDGYNVRESDSNLVVDMVNYEAPNELSVEDSRETGLAATKDVPIESRDDSSSDSSAEVIQSHNTVFVPDSERSEINLHSPESYSEKEKQEILASASVSQIDNKAVVPEEVRTDENLASPTTPVTDSIFEVADNSLSYKESAKAEGSVEANLLAKDAENKTTATNLVYENDDAIEEGNKIGNIDASDQVKGEPDLDEEASNDSSEEFIDTQETENLNGVYEGEPTLVSDGEEPAISDLSEDFVQAYDHREVDSEISDATEEREEIVDKGYFLSSGAALLSHPSKALTGGEDAYFIAAQNWLGVADGVGEWSLQGIIPGNYSRELMDNCLKIVPDRNISQPTNLKDVLYQSALEVKSRGSATTLVAYFDGQALQVANIGDTGFVVIRDGAIYKKSSPRFHELNFPYQITSAGDVSDLMEEYVTDLEEGDVIVTATDGLFDNLYEQEIASIVSKSLQANLELKEIAETLAKIAQEVGSSKTGRSPYADAIQAAGYAGVTGGKLDTVTVIVSVVGEESSSGSE